MSRTQPHQNRLLLSGQQVVFIPGPSGRCGCPDDTADLAVAVAVFRLLFPGALLCQSISQLISRDSTVGWNPLEYNSSVMGYMLECLSQVWKLVVKGLQD